MSRAFHLHAIEAENRRLEQGTPGAATVLGSIVTAAPEMLKVARTIERVAAANVSVMLLGASGTGKELLARAVHDRSPRREGAFVAINCAAIPENLLEAELFGYERGAFTGAVKTTPGKIELAEGGTLFLDEVGDIPLPLQVKLLRFLQERVIERIGGRSAIPVDTRIVCATHQDLDAMQRRRALPRGPLLPPRRDRRSDPVAGRAAGRRGAARAAFRQPLRARAQSRASRASRPTPSDAIDGYAWPGNVRELENRIKRAVIMADGKLVTAADLDLGERAPASRRRSTCAPRAKSPTAAPSTTR